MQKTAALPTYSAIRLRHFGSFVAQVSRIGYTLAGPHQLSDVFVRRFHTLRTICGRKSGKAS